MGDLWNDGRISAVVSNMKADGLRALLIRPAVFVRRFPARPDSELGETEMPHSRCSDLIVRDWRYPDVGIRNLDCEVSHVALIRADNFSICRNLFTIPFRLIWSREEIQSSLNSRDSGVFAIKGRAKRKLSESPDLL